MRWCLASWWRSRSHHPTARSLARVACPGDPARHGVSPWTTATATTAVRTKGGGRCVPSRLVPVPRSSPPDAGRRPLPCGAARRTHPGAPRPRVFRESVMADRRPSPLTALSTLTRRPRADGRAPRPALAGPAPSAPPARTSRMVDNAVYSGGRRVSTPETAAESRAELDLGEDRLAWLGLYRPEPRELGELAELFDLPELAVEDAIQAHQRPKFERYGSTLFVVLKAARYRDEVEEVEFGELHLFLGQDFVVTVRHSESPDLARVRRRLES